jgi:hypothetical protein
MSAGQGVAAVSSTTEDTGGIASTLLILLSRALYTAGAAMQAAMTDASPIPDNGLCALSVGMTFIPISAASLLTDYQKYAAFACTCIDSRCAGTVDNGDSRSVQVTLPSGAVDSASQAQQALGPLLDAAAQHAKQLEEAAGISSSPGDVHTMDAKEVVKLVNTYTSNMHIWRQVLGSEQGRQLPQALMDVGSLLCAALPSRSCCNEPSCCCFDKPSEVQLAAGKGTKCSRCGVARYCCVAHQRRHWKQHKPACRAIAAAAASAREAAAAAAKQPSGLVNT